MSLQLDQNTGDEGGLLSSKVWKILINGFGEGMKSVGNLQIIALELVFNKGIKGSTSGFCFVSSMCNNLSTHAGHQR